MTLEDLGVIALCTLFAAFGFPLIGMVWGERATIARFLRGSTTRYVAVRRQNANDRAPVPVRRPEAVEPEGTGSFVRSEPAALSATLALNADEIAAVQRMIRHNATAVKPTQTSTIQAGFGFKGRGDSPRYLRAKAIYDAFFVAPDRAPQYQPLDEQRRAVVDA